MGNRGIFGQLKRIGTLAAAAACIAPAAAWAADTSLVALEGAAERGDPVSQTTLAMRYEHAEGVARNFEQAFKLYCRAARAGHAEAQVKLGWMYANARGVPRDDAVAAALFAMAAHQGHEYAARMVKHLPAPRDVQLPPCMQPDPLPVVEQAAEEEPEISADPRTAELIRLVRELSPRYGVDARLAIAVAAVESGFNPKAVSPKNAQGLMQLMPDTAARFGVRKVFDPEQNVKGGLAYLRWLLAFFQGDVPLVVAAYNAGERAVEKYAGIPPYPETRDYVTKVTRKYKKLTHPFEAGSVEPSPVMARLKPWPKQ